jgi:hypothetical protein
MKKKKGIPCTKPGCAGRMLRGINLRIYLLLDTVVYTFKCKKCGEVIPG